MDILVKTMLRALVLGTLDNLRDAVSEHTVGRLQRAWLTATFPLVTQRADDPRLWRSCLRVAWHGLTHRDPEALGYFVQMRRNVECTRRRAEIARFQEELRQRIERAPERAAGAVH